MTTLSPRVGTEKVSQVQRCAHASRWTAAIVAAFLTLALLAPFVAAQSGEPKRVLIVMQEDVTFPVFRLIDENVRATLSRGLPGGVLIFSEHMDLFHFPDPMSQAQKKTWVQKKYASSKLDLVIAVGEVPTDMFPTVPLVYLHVELQDKLPSRPESQKTAASVWVELGAAKTIEVARRFQPNARQVVVVVGSSPAESLLLAQVRKQLADYSPQLQIIYLTNLGFSDILKSVETLGPESVVLFIALTRDGDGRLFIAADAIRKIAAVSGAPVYAIFDAAIGSGAVGGYVTRFGEVGKQAGETGLQFLAGKHPNDAIARNDYLFDWRQLQHWKISPSVLPPGSIVINRQPAFWELYRRYIVAAILVFLVQTLLILGLLWQRARKRKFQRLLVDKLAFEEMLCDLSTTFIQLSEELVGETIQKSLGRVAPLLKLDRISIFDYVSASAELKATYSWHNEAIQAIPAVIEANKFPRCTNLLLQGETILLPSPTPPLEEVIKEMKQVHNLGANSIAVVPLKAGDQLFGAITFASAKPDVFWARAQVERLKLVAEIFSNALMRGRALEARFRHTAIVESTEDAIISKNLDGIISSWNAGAQHLFEYTEAQAVGQSIKILIPEELRREEDKILQRLRAGERIEHYETVRLTKSGKRVNVSLALSPLRDSRGVIVGACKIAHDITEKKRAEKALSKSEERFRLFMDHSPAVAWMKDEQGHYIYMSETYLSHFGIRREDRQGKTDFEIYPHATAEVFRKNDQAALAAGEPIELIEEAIGLDGELYTWLGYKFPFQDTSGQLFVGGIAIDVTERRKARESLQALTRQLIHTQEEERARISRELHDDFSQRLALLGIGLGQLWKRLPSDKIGERETLMGMLKATKELSTDLHTLSHELHSSRLEHVGLVSALQGLCKDVSEKQKIKVQFKGCELRFTIPKDVGLCLFRVTQEALSNVVKHSGAKSARVEFGANESLVTLQISDSGTGFDPSVKKPNAGIGLIGMNERLRLVGGQLRVNSEPNRGTEVLAEVPLVKTEDATMAKSQVAGGQNVQTHTGIAG
jgi:PAS domain S-box-containing protein